MSDVGNRTLLLPGERRRFGRRATFKPARIAAPGVSIACTVVDISEGGARLHIPSPGDVPASFELIIEADDFAVLCRVVYRQEMHTGVAFAASPRRLSWGKGASPGTRGALREVIRPGPSKQ